MKIAIDLDDVVIDFMNPLLEFYNHKTGKTLLLKDFFSYNFEEIWGGTKQEAIEIVREFYRSDKFDNLKPIEDSLNILKKLSENIEITFLTSRFAEGKEKTTSWASKNCSFVKNPIIFAGEYQLDNKKATKGDICLKEKIPCIIEDNGVYALDCANNNIQVILFDKPWNKKYSHQNIRRVNNWKEAVEIINNLTKTLLP